MGRRNVRVRRVQAKLELYQKSDKGKYQNPHHRRQPFYYATGAVAKIGVRANVVLDLIQFCTMLPLNFFHLIKLVLGVIFVILKNLDSEHFIFNGADITSKLLEVFIQLGKIKSHTHLRLITTTHDFFQSFWV